MKHGTTPILEHRMTTTVLIPTLPLNSIGNCLAKTSFAETRSSLRDSREEDMQSAFTEDQFSKLLEEHKGIIYTIANSYCRNVEDRKDLIQEIVLQIWKSYDRYDERFKLSTWIYRIALNVAISAYRREQRRTERISPLDEIIIEPATETEKPDPRVATLYQIIDQLDEMNRALMILYLSDNSYREIAAILGITETNVATKINRLKLRLKEQFNEIIPD